MSTALCNFHDYLSKVKECVSATSVKALVLYFRSPFCLHAASLQGLSKIREGITKPAKISNGGSSTLDTCYALEKPNSLSVFSKKVPKHLILFVFFLLLPTSSPGGF